MICLSNAFKSSFRALTDGWSRHLPANKCVAGLKTLEEKVGLPPKPKRPLTPYFRFMQQTRPTLLKENPKAKAVEIVKMISKKWESIDQTIKQKLQDEYKKDQMAYVQSRAKYDSKVTDEQRAEIKQIKREVSEAKERRLLKKRVRDLGRPKRPASAFLRFIAAERKRTSQLSDESYRCWHQKVTEKWNRLSDEDKEIYRKETREDIEKYQKEITLWEQKMVRLGNVDVVRNETLVELPESKPKSRSST